MISIAVCDDDTYITEKLAECIKKVSTIKNISIDIEVFGDGRDLVDYINHGSRYDIILLDIEMKHVNGLEAAKSIRNVDKNVYLIYVTNYAGYSIEAYSVRPYQFLLKPIDEEKVCKYLSDILTEIMDDDFYFRYSANKVNTKILVQEVVYFESNARVIYIHDIHGAKHKFNGKLNNIEKIFSNSKVEFWRIHQSYLVNRKHIYRIGYSKIEMSNSVVLPISEDRRKAIREKYLSNMGACVE